MTQLAVISPEAETRRPHTSGEHLFQRILAGRFMPLKWIDPLCEDLLGRMLCVQPGQRITMEGVLHHPWFMKGGPCAHVALCPPTSVPLVPCRTMHKVRRWLPGGAIGRLQHS